MKGVSWHREGGVQSFFFFLFTPVTMKGVNSTFAVFTPVTMKGVNACPFLFCDAVLSSPLLVSLCPLLQLLV